MKNKIIFITCLALSSGSVVKGQTAVADSCYLNEGTAAISTVTYERLEKNSSLSLQNSLFGEVLGLTSMQGMNGIWDERASLSIRGLQSLSNNGILILVDGIERPIADLTVEEVESVSVLKDAAAVALYGYKGINGALLVKTKRGREGKMDIKISYDHGFNQPLYLPDMADSYTYAKAMNEAYANDGKSPRYNQFELEAFKNGKYPNYYPNVDWTDEVIGDWGSTNIYNLSFSGGSRKMRYYTLFNLENNSGFFKNTNTNEGYSNQNEYSKANIRMNLDVQISPSTSLQTNVLGILTEYNHSSYNTIVDQLYTVPSAAYPIKTEDGIWGGDFVWGGLNPVANLQAKGYSRSHARTLMADMKLTQKLDFITQGLGAYVKLAYDNSSTFWEIRTKTYSYAADKVSYMYDIPSSVTRVTGGKDTELTFTKNMNGPMYYRFNFDGGFDYNRTFGKHKVYSLLSWRFLHDVQKDRNNTINQQYLTSYTNYGFMNRYFVDLALVMSGSNRLPDGYKFAFSPTVSAAWNITREDFMRNQSVFDLLKLRASAGILHSDYVPSWNFDVQNFGGGGSYWFGNNKVSAGGTQESRFPTTYFRHERAMKYNVGLDARLFNSLSLTADAYYQKRDRIMVVNNNVSSILGVNLPYSPQGRVDSKGVELGLSYDKTIGSLTINAGARFTLSKNEVIENLQTPVAYDYLSTTGVPVGQQYGLEAIGFFKDEKDIMDSPKQLFSDVRPGDIKYKDQNGDDFIDENDRIAIGYNINVPEIYYAFNLGMEYKGFGFDAQFQGVGNYSAWMTAKGLYRPLVNNTTISNYYYENRWTPETPDAKFPRLTSVENANNTQNSTLWMTDASFLKLRHCEVYYKFPLKLISKARMKTAKLYVRGMDLFSIDKIEVTDPEVTGISYPVDRSIHVGFALNF